MVVTRDLLLSLLLAGHGTTPPSGVPPAERPLAEAAAALAAGEPKHALRALGPGAGPATAAPRTAVHDVANALRVAALAQDLNWFPGDGGAMMSEEDIDRAARPVPRPVADPDAVLLFLVAARLIPDIRSARAVADNSRAAQDVLSARRALDQLTARDAQLATLASPSIRAHLWIAAADVAHRAGLVDETAAALTTARSLAGAEPAALARLATLEGDMALEPMSRPELLGLRLDMDLPCLVPPDTESARAHYARADALFSRVGSGGGRAAIALRRAHLARRADDFTTCAAFLDAAGRAARESGAGALARLVETHWAVDRIGHGEDVPADALDELSRWSRTDGSGSFARGLVRLLVVRSRTWRDRGAALPALRCLRLARRLSVSLDAAAERELVERAHVELADRLNVRRASAVLLAADTAEAIAGLGDGPVAELAFGRAASLAITFDNTAQALGDADLAVVDAARLEELCRLSARVTDVSPMGTRIIAMVRAAAREAALMLPYHEGQRALAAGYRDEARRHFALALAAAEREGNGLLRCLLRYLLDCREEAHEVALDLFRRGDLHPDHAVSLFLRLADPATADRALAELDRVGWAGPPDRPWADPARRAELAMALGRHREAARLSDTALGLFERHAAQLVRDPLRSAATDHVDVAGMFHTAVRAHLALASEHSDGAALAASFELSDRCRGFAVDTLRSLVGLAPGPAREAARGWLRAGSRWAAAYQELTGAALTTEPVAGRTGSGLRPRILGAEDALDAAESEVGRHAPALLMRHQEERGALLEEVRAALPADAALLMYESFDQELLVWSVERDRVHHRELPVRARDLACDVRAFHTACATGGVDRAGAAALAERLLGPVAAAVDAGRRLYVVPHGALSLLPFHVLPHRGRPLGVSRTVSYLPSAALLTLPRAGERPRPGAPALLVGDPAYAPDRGLARLPGTATEVAAVARILGTGPPLTGAGATARNVAARAAGASVLHFATHGLVDERGPDLGRVVLAGHDQLAVGDLMGLDLTEALVVLSACHTGRGTATIGGDVVGLTRAAVTAGARHVVVSLWPVDDEAGCLTMVALYKRLAEGRGVAEALAAAQRWVRDQGAAGRHAAYEALRAQEGTATAAPWARDGQVPPSARAEDRDDLPYHWAPFVHIGG
ncbi:CHAT domain-containing protein [Streptomyces sp. NPDC049099]|uniref:CHAT domain-containing protein n=1 Tax=Streptomyces sp. NPDC049099 TaxID=3155768 RepID=UPI00343A2E3F